MPDNGGQSPTQPLTDPSPAAVVGLKVLQHNLNQILQTAMNQAREGLDTAPEQVAAFGDRLRLALSYFEPKIQAAFRWLFTSKETSNFTYSLTPTNLDYLATFVAAITNLPLATIRGYVHELSDDVELRNHVREVVASGKFYIAIDPHFDFGRRIGWYAFVRATKPKIVIETGVEQGLGSLVLTSALKRNTAEGHPGYYYGTDINPQCGYLFQGDYRNYGTLLIGDSISSLKQLNETVDLFINDSDHSAEYEAREYDVIHPKMSANGIILGDNAHVSSALVDFSIKTNRKFLFFKEVPMNHWYPGSGIGVSFV
jgi:hypothetical protein